MLVQYTTLAFKLEPKREGTGSRQCPIGSVGSSYQVQEQAYIPTKVSWAWGPGGDGTP